MNFSKRFEKENISSMSLNNGLKPNPELPSDKTAIIKRISEMYIKLKEKSKNIDPLYQAGGEWDHYIEERATFYSDLLNKNYNGAYEVLSNFWRNNLGPIVKEYAKYEQLVNREEPFLSRFENNVSKNYLIWKELFNMDAKQLEVPTIGNQWGIMIDDQLVVPKATRYHAHTQQVKNLMTNKENPVFAEIGGGYCGLAYYLLRDLPNLTYVDFDLPETLVIGAYYIMSAYPEKKVLLYGEYDNIKDVNLDEYDALFLGNFELPNFQENSVDVFYNSFSLSEMPKATSTEYISQISKICNQYFLHNNMDRAGVINRGFERTPASQYAIDSTIFKLIYKQFDLFHGHDGDYKEFLYERIK